jgi:hypothetical protein
MKRGFYFNGSFPIGIDKRLYPNVSFEENNCEEVKSRIWFVDLSFDISNISVYSADHIRSPTRLGNIAA